MSVLERSQELRLGVESVKGSSRWALLIMTLFLAVSFWKGEVSVWLCVWLCVCLAGFGQVAC